MSSGDEELAEAPGASVTGRTDSMSTSVGEPPSGDEGEDTEESVEEPGCCGAIVVTALSSGKTLTAPEEPLHS